MGLSFGAVPFVCPESPPSDSEQEFWQMNTDRRNLPVGMKANLFPANIFRA